MNSIKTFTKKDLILVLACVVFLLAALGAAGNKGRSRAKNLVCLSNLHQWGAIFNSYTSDHDGYFNHGAKQASIIRPGPCGFWFNALRPYYGNSWNLLLCPTATKAAKDYSEQGPFFAWSIKISNCHPAPGEASHIIFTGSYGINSWTNYLISNTAGYARPPEQHWKNVNGVKGRSNIPVFADSTHFDGWPHDYDTPPPNPDVPIGDTGFRDEMRQFCIDRHNYGTINMLFMDWSARKVGLRELWTLKWHREFDTANFLTLAGCDGDIEEYNALWNSYAPWMTNFEAF